MAARRLVKFSSFRFSSNWRVLWASLVLARSIDLQVNVRYEEFRDKLQKVIGDKHEDVGLAAESREESET